MTAAKAATFESDASNTAGSPERPEKTYWRVVMPLRVEALSSAWRRRPSRRARSMASAFSAASPAGSVRTRTPSRPRKRNPAAARASRRQTTAAAYSQKMKEKFAVAAQIDAAMTSMMKPTSSGSLIGVRKRMIESEPSRPRESGSECCRPMKSVVTDTASSGKARCTWLPVPRRS